MCSIFLQKGSLNIIVWQQSIGFLMFLWYQWSLRKGCGDMAKPKILFLCIGNTCRSQMAEGFALAYGQGNVEVQSAGTQAFGEVNALSASAMAQLGIDISVQSSDQLSLDMIDWADVVVTLGCCRADELCPAGFKGRKMDWPIADPFGGPADMMERVRDDIDERVKGLLEELNARDDGGLDN
jgi:protein-tyrosine-phosphatase